MYTLVLVGLILWYIRYRLRTLRHRAAQLQEEVDKATATIRAQNESLQQAYLELAKQKDLIEAQRQDLIDSLLYARRIQTALLPRESILKQFFSKSFIFFQPRDIVSGDIYWFYSPPSLSDMPRELYLLVADCTGHGVPGAFISLLSLTLIERVLKEGGEGSPAAILDVLSRQIAHMLNPDAGEVLKDGFEGVLCRFVRSQADRWQLEYAAARRPFWIVRGNTVMELPKDPLPVGLSELPVLRGATFTPQVIDIYPGDLLYFSTDGFTDQLGGAEGKRFGLKRFRTLLTDISRLPFEYQPEQLQETFFSWTQTGNFPQVDDILIVGLQIP
ncbi:MAG: SpoIIE family protein phosphatase [Bacteroidia bacterium]|nr:SpoIIE family protein phosphatase [Bacteroidia bacterium]